MNSTHQRPSKMKAVQKTAFPLKSSLARCIKPKLKAYYSKRSIREQSFLSEEGMLQLIAEHDVIDIMKQNTKAEHAAKRISTEEYLKLLKKYSRKQLKILACIQKGVAFGPKCKELIFIIANLVYNKIKVLPPSVQEDYLTGKYTTYTLQTSTRSLAKVLNQLELIEDSEDCGENSFRGESGFYAALLDCGFIVHKQNKKLNGELDDDGYCVELTIDLDWVFGYSIEIPTEIPNAVSDINAQRGISTHLSYNFSQESTKESGVENSADTTQVNDNLSQPNFQRVQPTEVGNKNTEVEGQASKPHTPFSQENFAPAPPNFPQDVDNSLKTAEMVEKFAIIACRELMKSIYTPENFAKNRIKVNKMTYYNSISSRDKESMMDKMFDIYYFINQKVGDWQQTHVEIIETIQKTGEYYKLHSADYIYSPLHFLKTDMATRSLVSAHRLYFSQSEAPNTKLEAQFTKDTHIVFEEYEHYNWLIKERKAYSLSLARYARKLTKEVVDDAIRFVRAKYKRGWKSKKDIISYTMGVIANIENTPEAKAKIKKDADEQTALVKAGITWGDEFRKSDSTESNPQPTTPSPSQIWLDKVKPIVVKVSKKYRSSAITSDKLNKIAERAMERNANDEQIFIWCEGIVKGTSKIF